MIVNNIIDMEIIFGALDLGIIPPGVGIDIEAALATMDAADARVAKRKFDLVFNELRVLNKNTSNKIKREYAMNKRFKK